MLWCCDRLLEHLEFVVYLEFVKFAMESSISNVFKCSQCGKSYKQETWYKKHILSHNGTLKDQGPKAASTSHSESANICDTSACSVSTPVIPSNVSFAQVSASASSSLTGNADHNAAGQDSEEEDPVFADIAAAQNMEWEDWSGTDDDEEVDSYYGLDTEPWLAEEAEERLRAARAGLAEATLDRPKKKPPPPPPLVKCTLCKVPFTTLEGYINHKVGHGLKAAILRLPSLEEVIGKSLQLAEAVLTDLQSSKLNAGYMKAIKTLASDMQSKLLTEEMKPFFMILCERLYFTTDARLPTPTVFVNAYDTNSSAALIDVAFRSSLLDVLLKVIDTVECNVCGTCSVDSHGMCSHLSARFLTTFTRKFSEKLLAYMLRVLGEKNSDAFVTLEERYAVTYQSTISVDFKQNMHYIGGSNVKSFLKNALRVKHRSAEWQRVIDTVRSYFLISELAAAPDKELMAWTESVDRGKLTKISKKALEFFVQLGTEVKPLEKLDGSLLNDEVIDKITNSPQLLLRWDELKGKLCQKEAFKLLHALTMHFCVTWRNGIIGRRKDEMAADARAQKFGTGGLAFRSKLAGS